MNRTTPEFLQEFLPLAVHSPIGRGLADRPFTEVETGKDK